MLTRQVHLVNLLLRKWLESKQQLCWWPELALLGCCLVSLHTERASGTSWTGLTKVIRKTIKIAADVRCGDKDNLHLPHEVQRFSNGHPSLHVSGKIHNGKNNLSLSLGYMFKTNKGLWCRQDQMKSYLSYSGFCPLVSGQYLFGRLLNKSSITIGIVLLWESPI